MQAMTDTDFHLHIEMGNDAMQDVADVARALSAVCNALERGETEGTIRDLNGNTVGNWKFED